LDEISRDETVNNKTFKLSHVLFAALCATQATVLHAQTMCTFDVGGTSGDLLNHMKDYQLAVKGWGVTDFKLKVYQSEGEAVSDYKKGLCDGVMATGFATRDLNSFTSTLSAVGAIPSNSIAKTALTLMANPKLAGDMVQGNNEVAGVLPLGSAYFVTKDKKINDLLKSEGMRVGVLEVDPSQAPMVKKVGSKPVYITYNNAVNKFRDGQIDILPAPALAYEPLEIYRAMGANGGIIKFPLSFMTAVVVLNKTKFPAGFGQQSRTWFAGRINMAMATLNRYERGVPESRWTPVSAENQVGYLRLMRQMRLEFVNNGVYNKKMSNLLKKLRCQQDPTNFECMMSGE
jgi:hypothetical protein